MVVTMVPMMSIVACCIIATSILVIPLREFGGRERAHILHNQHNQHTTCNHHTCYALPNQYNQYDEYVHHRMLCARHDPDKRRNRRIRYTAQLRQRVTSYQYFRAKCRATYNTPPHKSNPPSMTPPYMATTRYAIFLIQSSLVET